MNTAESIQLIHSIDTHENRIAEESISKLKKYDNENHFMFSTKEDHSPKPEKPVLIVGEKEKIEGTEAILIFCNIEKLKLKGERFKVDQIINLSGFKNP